MNHFSPEMGRAIGHVRASRQVMTLVDTSATPTTQSQPRPRATSQAKLRCRRMGERSPMTRLGAAQQVFDAASLHCGECVNKTLCAKP